MRQKKVKVQIPELILDTIREHAKVDKMTLSEYINYLIYKENYLHLSMHSLHEEKPFTKFYKKYNEEKKEKEVWSTLFNLT